MYKSACKVQIFLHTSKKSSIFAVDFEKLL